METGQQMVKQALPLRTVLSPNREMGGESGLWEPRLQPPLGRYYSEELVVVALTAGKKDLR